MADKGREYAFNSTDGGGISHEDIKEILRVPPEIAGIIQLKSGRYILLFPVRQD